MTACDFAVRLGKNLDGPENAGARRKLVAAAVAFERGETIHGTMADAVRATARTIAFTAGGRCLVDASLTEAE